MVIKTCFFILFNISTLCLSFNPANIANYRSSVNLYSTTSEKIVEVAETTTYDGLALVDVRTGKPTGISYLPPSTVQRARDNGSPIEKIKIEKDGTSAFVDVYEYARKIRDGEMTWEEVDKADLDTVRTFCLMRNHLNFFQTC
jgi:ferredoxin-nitrite reductase